MLKQETRNNVCKHKTSKQDLPVVIPDVKKEQI